MAEHLATPDLWIRDVALLPMVPDAATFLSHMDIGIAGSTIAAIQPTGAALPRRVQVLEGAGYLAMPGLVNCHSHVDMAIFRGTGEGARLMEWLALVTQVQARMTEEDVYWSTLLSLLEFTRHGITTFADMSMSWASLPQAVLESGLRAVLYQGLVDAWPHWVETWGDGAAQIRRAAEVFRAWHGVGEGRIQVGLGPHSPYGASELLLRQAAARALEWGSPLHVHLAETAEEVRQIQEEHRLTPTAYLASVGLLDAPTLAAHAVHLTEEDQDLLRAKGVSVAHNPGSNLKLRSGLAPVASLRSRGVHVGLGTDGAGSNDRLDLFREAYLAAVQQPWPPDAQPSRETLHMATLGGAKALGLDDLVGSLEVGKRADIILLRLDAPDLAPGVDPAKTLVYAATGCHVDTVIVDGRILLRHGEFQALDAERILAENRARAARLFGGPPTKPQEA